MALRTPPLWRLLIVLSISALFAAALTSCGDSRITSSPDQLQALRYQDEAEQLALYLQGTLHPSEWLTKQISHELSLIRDTWGDSIPLVNKPFQSPWYDSRANVLVDTSLYIEIMNCTNADWNILVEKLGVQIKDYRYSWFPRYLYTESEENLHPIRVAEHFVGFPGVAYVKTVEIAHPWPNGYARKLTDGKIKYYFRQWLCPEINDEYYYFEVDQDTAIYRGKFAECWGDYWPDVPNAWDLFYAWQDSVEANRPDWVDDARHEVYKVETGPYFHWSRPQP